MQESDNAAGRLHSLLTEMINYHPLGPAYTLGSVSDRHITVRQVLKEVFHLGENANDQVIFRDLVELFRLVDEVERNMQAVASIDEDLYLESLENIREFLMLQYLGEVWVDRKEKLDKGDLKALAFCSRALSKNQVYSAETIPQEELDGLTQELQSLYNKVNDSSLNVEIKTIILDHLEIIRRAIHDYRIRGLASLREALERNIGALVLNKPLFDEAGQSSDEISSFKIFLTKFASVVAFASHATAIAERVDKYLPAILK